MDMVENKFKQTEIGLIPEDWEVVRLGEVADFYIGRTPPRNLKEYWRNGSFPWVSIEDMRNRIIKDTKEKINFYALEKYFKNRISKKGSLLMSFKLTIGRTSILDIDAVHNEAIITIKSNQEKVERMFLYYYLPTINYFNYMDKAVKGNTLNKSKIENLLIPLPTLSEQKKIAEVLSAVQEAKEKTEEVIKATKELKKSLMKFLFTYGPVSLKEKENVKLKETETGLIPEDWEVVRLGEVADIKSGGTPSRNNPDFWINGNIPWIRSEQCQDSFIESAIEFITEKGLNNSSAKIFPPDTVLIAMVGATLGKTGYLKIKAATNQNVAGVYSYNLAKLSQLFLFYTMQSRYSDFAKEGGYKMANLSFIRSFKIPLPTLSIQQKIADILSAVDEKIQAEENKKKVLENLFKTLLNNLMTGRIRVG